MVNRSPQELVRGLQELYSKKGFIGTAIGVAEFLTPHPHDAYFKMGREEVKKGLSAPVPWWKRLSMYRQGFQSHHYRFYGFDDGVDPEPYLDEFCRIAYTSSINDDPSLLDDKEQYHDLLSGRGFDEFLPQLYGQIDDGEFSGSPPEDVFRLLEQEGTIVIKPTTGAAGSGVMVCKAQSDGVSVNGVQVREDQFLDSIENLDSCLVTEYCEQADYAADIYPGSENTIRVLAMQPEGEEPFIAIAVHRFGSDSTGGLDNFSQGGLSAEVNLDSGHLSSAAEYSTDGSVRWHDHHPDTGAQVAGVEVPGWQQVKNDLLEVMKEIPELRYVGWDVLVTGSGEFVLLEGNNKSDVDLLQVHRPLLADQMIRAFYRDQGVPV